ncbi:TetR/AcrR family transcriptional regulator C-terminal domain-containing protein [Neorhizobium sp. DT-125]|uniref:TetR/AcrR family transcriptional regulator C-terminal domain-containing protein n=1 Tax=Neorhizobium sp. DT-125 TaxID=3396163 RepID=UPI003F1DC7FE
MNLDRQRITDAALDLLDRTGLEGLTMRKLADALEVQAPALYWYFPGKQALLDEMAEALVAGIPGRITVSGDCREVMIDIATELRLALLSRRDGARVFAGTFVARPNVLQVAEIALAAFSHAGFSTRTAARAIASLFYFVLGFVIEEQALVEQSRGTGGTHPMEEKFKAFSAADYPHLAAALPDLLETDQNARFVFGVDLILTGLLNGGTRNR